MYRIIRGVWLFGIAVVLIVSSARASVFENFNTLAKNSYASPMDTTWHGFALHNTLCDTMKAYGTPPGQRSPRTNYGTAGGNNPPYIEYVGSDGLGKDGGVGTFSFLWRPWAIAPVNHKVMVSINGGAYDTVGTLSGTDTTWQTFSWTMNDSRDHIRIKILSVAASPNRLIVDNFSITDFAASTGACCYWEGACTVTTQAECAATFGTYMGDGTVCTPNPCAQPTGACCFPDGSCAVETQAACTGIYQGDGTVCDPNPCPQPTGACCFADGSCAVETQAACTAAGGVYQGNNTVCTPNPCPPSQYETIYFWDLSTNPGWTTQGQWAWGTPQGLGGQRGYPDPTQAHSGINVYGYNLAGDYANNKPEYSLTSTAINLTGITDVYLDFWRWLGVESPSYDHASVQVSTDGTQWTTIWSNPTEIADNQWTQQHLSVSQWADNQSHFYFRFTMGTTDGSNTYCGWNLDDVTILGKRASPNDLCANAQAITSFPASFLIDNTGATDDGAAACGFSSTIYHGIWYTVTLPGAYFLTASTCNAYGTLNDTKLSVYMGMCGNLVCVGGNDDAGSACSGHTLRSTFSWCAEAGTTYYILVGSYGTTYGTFQLDITQGASCGTGACCFADGTCQVIDRNACVASGGIYRGGGTTCSPNLCPPPNDQCTAAQPMVSLPATIVIDNTNATDDGAVACGFSSAMHHGLWYTVTPTDAYYLTASTCNAYGTVNDTKLSVYTGTCANLVCVGGQDDDSTCTGHTFRSTFAWCASAGVTYYILVGSYGTSYGTFQLDVSQGAYCGESVGACCLSEICSVISQAACMALDGTYLGDGTSCSSPDCNGNGIPDECDMAFGVDVDCNHNGVLDECEQADGSPTSLTIQLHSGRLWLHWCALGYHTFNVYGQHGEGSDILLATVSARQYDVSDLLSGSDDPQRWTFYVVGVSTAYDTGAQAQPKSNLGK
jgi:hypothetical protein